MGSLGFSPQGMAHNKYAVIGVVILAGILFVAVSFIISSASRNDGNEELSSSNTSDVLDLVSKEEEKESIIDAFQEGHSFFIQINESGSQEDDHQDYVLGQQSLKLTTNGDGTAVFTRKTGISPPIDLENKLLKVWLKVSDTTKIKELRVTVTGDRFESLRNYWLYGSDGISTELADNKWVVVTVEPQKMRDLGLPDLSRVDTIQLRIADNGTGPVSVWFNGLEMVDEDQF